MMAQRNYRGWYTVLASISIVVIYLNIEYNLKTIETLRSTRGVYHVRYYPELIETIRRKHLTPPSSRETPYKLTNPTGLGLAGEKFHRALLKILNSYNISQQGFFVECGALDGEYLSETLDLEMYANWTGLLIEGSPSKVPLLKSKNRKAWIADVCLSGDPYRTVEFITKVDQTINWKRGNGKINPVNPKDAPANFEGAGEYKSEGFVECFSLHNVLKAVGVASVDLLVLDVEGQEFNILTKYPFHLLPIKVLALEHWLTKHREDLVAHLLENGYQLLFASVSDYIFALK